MVNLNFESIINKEKSIQDELSPRDLLFLKNLTRYGLNLIEIKVSPISPVIGKKMTELGLPEDCILINIIKNNKNYFPSEDTTLESGDIVYFLSSQIVEDSLKKVFIPVQFK